MPREQGRSPARIVLGIVVAAVLPAGVMAGCGTDRPGAAVDGDFTPATVSGRCEHDGQKAACHVETGRVGDVVNCFSGTRTCKDGVWGPCGGEGTTSTRSSRTAGSPRRRSSAR